ncbi:hypothetical protein ACJMK2_015991 [Sinanodonta woodiana]|uniref:Uncharacterized protein n=1 Tax=Sinanodonta woodiana TaxID=1069815 RepID=A0ABD3US74_SINWO
MVAQDFDVAFQDRLSRMKTWSRHHHEMTPREAREIYTTTYKRTFDAKKLDFNPDRSFIDRYSSVSRNHLKTSVNQRAREGFRYWVIERPRPSHFGKYGTGSYKMTLGLGMSPRT